VNFAQFSPDGHRIATAASDWLARLIELPEPGTATAPWLPDFAEAVTGNRLDPQHSLQPVPADVLRRLAQKFGASVGGVANSPEWVRWFFMDRASRPLSPAAAMSHSEYQASWLLMAKNSDTVTALNELRHLAFFAPASGVFYEQLAKQLLGRDLQIHPHSAAEAVFLRRMARDLGRLELETAVAGIDALAHQGEPIAALRQLEALSKDWPSNLELWNVRARVLEDSGHLDFAYASLDRTRAADEPSLGYY